MAPNLFIYRLFYEIEFATLLFLPYVFFLFVCLVKYVRGFAVRHVET